MKAELDSAIAPLLNCAEKLTASNTVDVATTIKPIAATAQSPICELLVDEIVALVGTELVQRLQQAKTPSRVYDWIAVAAIYNWIKADGLMAKNYLMEIGDSPQNASLALARTFALTINPPPDAASQMRDRLGLFLEVAAATIVLCIRALFFSSFLPLVDESQASFDLQTILRQAWVPDILFAGWDTLWIQATVCMLACCYLALECWFIPYVLEFARRGPLRGIPTTRYIHWRPDAIHSLWALHAFVLQCVLTTQFTAAAFAARDWLRHDTAIGTLIVVCLVAELMAILAVATRLLKPSYGS